MGGTGGKSTVLGQLIDAQGVGPRLVLLYGLCALCLMIDGFDAQVIGFVAPAIVESWRIKPAALAPVFAIGLFGMVLGSLCLSTVADRIGRRPVLIGATVWFGLAVLATSLAHNLPELLTMRFITGFGLGGIMPNVLALSSEYTPARHRTTAVTLMGGGFTLGAAIGGFSAAALIPVLGWQALFVIGGVPALAIAALLYLLTPESAKFLAVRRAGDARIAAAIRRVFPVGGSANDLHFRAEEQQDVRAPVAHLFRERRGWPTVLIWIVTFMNLLELFFLSNWLPTLLRSARVPIHEALLASTALQVGGVFGTLIFAGLARRLNLLAVLCVNFVVAAAAIFSIGYAIPSPNLLLTSIFMAGLCIVGGQPAISALAASYYPTFIRSTGVGWALGIGRFGSIAGPLVGGLFLQMSWGVTPLFMAAAAPALVAMAGLIALSGAPAYRSSPMAMGQAFSPKPKETTA